MLPNSIFLNKINKSYLIKKKNNKPKKLWSNAIIFHYKNVL